MKIKWAHSELQIYLSVYKRLCERLRRYIAFTDDSLNQYHQSMVIIMHPFHRANGRLAWILCLPACAMYLLGEYMQLLGTSALQCAGCCLCKVCLTVWSNLVTFIDWRKLPIYWQDVSAPFVATPWQSSSEIMLQTDLRPLLALSTKDLSLLYVIDWEPLLLLYCVWLLLWVMTQLQLHSKIISFIGEDIQHPPPPAQTHTHS